MHHHQARWHAGLFARESRLKFYDFFWKVEAGSRYAFDFKFDPFRAMRDGNRVYGCTDGDLGDVDADASQSLYQITAQFIEENPETIKPTADISWVLGPKKDGHPKQFAHTIPESTRAAASTAADPGRNDDAPQHENGRDASGLELPSKKRKESNVERVFDTDSPQCAASASIEMGSLAFFRSPSFAIFFNHLDGHGTFYHHRIARNPVLPLGAALLAPDAIWRLDEDAFCRAGTCTTVYDTPPPVDPALEIPFLAGLIGGDHFGWNASYLAGLEDYGMLWRQYWDLVARDFDRQAVRPRPHQGFTHMGDTSRGGLIFLSEAL